MKMITRNRIVGLLVLSMLFVVAVPALAQPGRRPPGPPPGHRPPPPYHHHKPSDLEKTLRVIGAVGAVAAAANGYSPYHYHRQPRPVVVVPQPRPTVVVERPVVVEKVVERPIVVEKEVYIERQPEALPTDHYSSKLGATFVIQNMKIPGYVFKAARLTSNPVDGSPLQELGLVKGDVITRLDNNPVDNLGELDLHEKNTQIRYIKTGTTKVLIGRVYIPTDAELNALDEDTFYAP